MESIKSTISEVRGLNFDTDAGVLSGLLDEAEEMTSEVDLDGLRRDDEYRAAVKDHAAEMIKRASALFPA